MKVGILTYHWANNYGAVLQAYALLSKLKEMGHDAYIIDRIRTFSGWRRLYHSYSYKHYFSWYRFLKFNKEFLDPKTPLCTSTKQLIATFPSLHFDAVIVGSDQVWRESFMGHNYFLDFVSGSCKRISYAASFGLSEWSLNEAFTSKAKQLMQQFDKVSVREKTGIEICKKVFDVDAELVLDPTLLWDARFYEEKLLNKGCRVKEPKVVAYILGENKDQNVAAKNIAQEENIGFVDLWSHKSLVQGHYTVEEWLGYIRDAKYVITNSFHATVFSILFHKQFVVLNNKSGGSDRISTLLNYLGLQYLFVSTTNKDMYKALGTQIDYHRVDRLLANLRDGSLSFLKNI